MVGLGLLGWSGWSGWPGRSVWAGQSGRAGRKPQDYCQPRTANEYVVFLLC